MDITSWDQLERLLEQELRQSLKLIANDIKTIISDYVKDKVYNSYSPKEYQRTGDLLNSLSVGEVKKIGNNYEVAIFFDPAFIRSNEVEDSLFNQHMSVDGSDIWNGIPVNELVPFFIEEGIKNSPYYNRKGIESMKYVEKMLRRTNRHLKVLSKILKSKGYNIKIS